MIKPRTVKNWKQKKLSAYNVKILLALHRTQILGLGVFRDCWIESINRAKNQLNHLIKKQDEKNNSRRNRTQQ